MSDYEDTKIAVETIIKAKWLEKADEELIKNVIQAADKEIADLQYRAGSLETQNSDLAGHIRGNTCMMCNFLERAICFEQKTDLEKEIATKDADLARLREALQDIDKLEIRRMYESCPDCYSESLGCSENKVCAQFKGRTLIQKVIDEALKSQ